jgi:hypothetical protein
MTFLTKLGAFLARGIAVLTGLEPLIAPLFGSKASATAGVVTKIANDLTAVGQIVVTAEALIQVPGSGAAKLSAAAPLVTNIVRTSELVSGHEIADEALFLQGCTNITSGVAQVLNSLKSDNVKSQGKSLLPAPLAQQAPVPANLGTSPTTSLAT